MNPYRMLVLVLGLWAGGLAAAPLRVVTLHSVLTEIVAEVGGESVRVTCLVQPGADLHTFSPTPADVKAIAEAELVVASGFDLEPYLDKLVARSGTKARLVSASAAITHPVRAVCGQHGDHDHGEIDPHWWHGLANMREVVGLVRDELARARPAAAVELQARAQAYLRTLDELATWAQTELAALPSTRRRLVTSHDAFGYLAHECGFTVHPLQGVSPDAEPNARDLAALIELIKRERIRAVFADNTENPQRLAAMLRESGAELGGTLYADGLGPASSPAATFAAMYRHNLATLIRALR